MRKSANTGLKSRKKPASNLPMVTDFGIRKILSQNFSKLVALPKTALTNCGLETSMVNVKLVQQDGEKFIKLTPIKEKGEEKS